MSASSFDHSRYAALRGETGLGALVHVAERTTSTMDDARAGADARGADGCGDAYLAIEQTAGRGRFGRAWLSTPGTALLVTFHLCRTADGRTPLLSAAGGLAIADAIEATTNLQTEQKWPNDVLVDGRKLVGVLSEARPAAGDRLDVFLGIGVNVLAGAVADLPEEVRRGVTSIEGAGAEPPDLESLLAALAAALERRIELLDRDAEAFRADWRSRLTTLGRTVRLATGTSEVEGLAVDVTGLGELTLRLADGSSRNYAAGDVTTL